jgi:hypothetical protein
MDVVTHGPLPVASRIWQPRPGAHVFSFVCKATFKLAPGELALAAEQEPIHHVDRPWSDSVTSLYVAGDLAPYKPRADVVLIGNAYAPGNKPARQLVARLTVGPLSKAIEVWCDRTVEPSGAVQEGPPFTNLPLLYERAAGGPGTSNPVGLPAERDAYGAIALPNLVPAGARPGEGPIAPVGFGPIAARWPGRKPYLGRLADQLDAERLHEAPLPPDFDAAFFNVAPPDQQLDALLGDEMIVLENLHPKHASLAMTLPDLDLRATLGDQAIPMTCDTLWIDTSRGLCALTYRGTVPLRTANDVGWVVISLQQGGTVALDGGPARAAALPFAQREAAAEPMSPLAQTMGGLPFGPQREVPAKPPPPRAGAFQTAQMSIESLAPAPPPPAAPPPAPPPPAAPPPAPSFGIAPQAAPPAPPPPVPASAGWLSPTLSAKSASAPSSPWATPGGSPETPTIAPVTAAPPPAPPPTGDFRGGGGALLASNAAAGVVEGQGAPQPSGPMRVEPVRLAPAAAPAQKAPPPDTADLVFFDADSMPRVRRVDAWKKLLAKLDDRAPDADEEDPAREKDPKAAEDRREILEILVRGQPSDMVAVEEAVQRAAKEDGRFVAPIVLVAGEIALPFDEVEALKATVTVVSPLVGNDENLRASVEVAKDFLRQPNLACAPAVAEGLTTRVKEAWGQGKRAVPAGYLDAQTERALLEQRAYQRRRVLGGRRLRALFTVPPPVGAGAAPPPASPIVTYLPEDAADKLPLFPRIKVRIVARVHPPLDHYEQSSFAFEALALARLSPPFKRAS